MSPTPAVLKNEEIIKTEVNNGELLTTKPKDTYTRYQRPRSKSIGSKFHYLSEENEDLLQGKVFFIEAHNLFSFNWVKTCSGRRIDIM